MITPPSAEFTTAASAGRRYPKLKVDFLWTDPFVQSGNVVTSTHLNDFCGLLSSAVEEDLLLHTADTVLVTPHKYVINDGTLINDGTFYPIPSTVAEAANNQVGWYTSGICDGSGNFAEAQELTITFSEVRTIKQIIVVGEPTLGEYPTDFDVEIYNESDVLLNTTTNFTGSSVETQIDFTEDNITTAKYMILKLNSWSVVNTIGKIVEFFGIISDTFYGSDVVLSMDILEESESDEDTSPFGSASCNELTLELQNISLAYEGSVIEDPFLPENTNSYLQNSITKNVRITPYIGFMLPDESIEYVSMGIFWSIDWDVSQSKVPAQIVARDRMELLRNNTFLADEILEDVTLYEVAEYVLNNAKVNIPLNDLEWEISDDLDDYTIAYVWLGKVTYFEALRKIATACMGRVFCDRSGKVIIEDFNADQESGSPDIIITDDFFDQKRKSHDIKNYVTVPVVPLSPEVEENDHYTSGDINVEAGDSTVTESVSWEDDALMDHDVTIFDEDGVTMAVSGTPVYYPWGAEITFAKISGASGTFKYTITGRKLKTQQHEPEIAYDQVSINLYKKQEYVASENNLIQTSAIAAIIAQAMLCSLLLDWRDVEDEVQGNPCTEIGDIADIEVYSKLSVSHETRIVRQQFKASSGGLRCVVTGRKTIDFGGV